MTRVRNRWQKGACVSFNGRGCILFCFGKLRWHALNVDEDAAKLKGVTLPCSSSSFVRHLTSWLNMPNHGYDDDDDDDDDDWHIHYWIQECVVVVVVWSNLLEQVTLCHCNKCINRLTLLMMMMTMVVVVEVSGWRSDEGDDDNDGHLLLSWILIPPPPPTPPPSTLLFIIELNGWFKNGRGEVGTLDWVDHAREESRGTNVLALATVKDGSFRRVASLTAFFMTDRPTATDSDRQVLLHDDRQLVKRERGGRVEGG